MKLLTLVLLTAILVPSFSAGETRGTEITIYSGISFLDADAPFSPCPFCKSFPGLFVGNQSLDSSLLIGFKMGRYLTENIEVEGNFSVAPSRDIHTDTSFDCPVYRLCLLEERSLLPFFEEDRNAVTYYYGGNFLYNISTARVTPFFSFGLGGVSTDLDVETKHNLALCIGGGTKFYLGKLGIRFEVNDHIIPDHFLTHDTEHDLQVQYGLLWNF